MQLFTGSRTSTESPRWRVLLAALALLALLGAFAAGCGDDDDDDDQAAQEQERQEFPAGTTMADLQEKGEITIGVKFDVPPFGFKNPQTNKVEGFDVDLGNEIAEKLGVRPKFIEAISDNRIPFLKRGTADLILSTMTINKERDQEIDFSTPYYIARGRILVPKGSDIRGLEDLEGNSVCTALGSTYEETLREQAPDADLKLVDSYSECLELVQNESVDAVSTDDVILTGMIIQDENLQLVGDELTTEPYGAGIKEGDREFQQFVSGVVDEWKSGGGWAEAYQKWVGQYTNEEQQPPDMTLQEALEASG
jgi:glutamate transport system substrate-binding protein